MLYEVITEKKNTDHIVNAIRKLVHIDEPGKGIIFVQDVIQAYGLS